MQPLQGCRMTSTDIPWFWRHRQWKSAIVRKSDVLSVDAVLVSSMLGFNRHGVLYLRGKDWPLLHRYGLDRPRAIDAIAELAQTGYIVDVDLDTMTAGIAIPGVNWNY